jgi:hypothetical protein
VKYSRNYEGDLHSGFVLVGAGTAFLLNQPTYVIFSLGLTGIAIISAMSFGVVGIAREYRKIKMRQSIAQDL